MKKPSLNFQITKDQLQKILLSSLLFAALLYCYFTFLIKPLNRADTATTTAISEYDNKIKAADRQLGDLSKIEDNAKHSTEIIAQINSLIPEGEPIAWFPPRMRAFFQRHGIDGAAVHLDRKETISEPGLDQKFDIFHWTIELPLADFVPLCIAISGLENEELLLNIEKVQILAVPDNPELQKVSLAVSTFMHLNE